MDFWHDIIAGFVQIASITRHMPASRVSRRLKQRLTASDRTASLPSQHNILRPLYIQRQFWLAVHCNSYQPLLSISDTLASKKHRFNIHTPKQGRYNSDEFDL
jgi:hypothetical protein